MYDIETCRSTDFSPIPLRDCLIARMHELFQHCKDDRDRWAPVKEYLYTNILQFDGSTKRGRKAITGIDLTTIDYDQLSDTELVWIFEIVVRRFSMQR